MSTKDLCRGFHLGLTTILCMMAALPTWSQSDAAASEITETQSEAASKAPSGYLGFLKTYEEEDDRGRFRVHSVMAGGSAEKAGLRKDDVVVAVNGHSFRFTTNLKRFDAFNWVEPGDRIELSVERDGLPLTVELIAAEMPDDVARRWKDRRAQLVQVTQTQVLREIAAGEGATLTVAREAATGDFEISAESHESKYRVDLASLLTSLPVGEALGQLHPGDQLKLQVKLQVSARIDKISIEIIEAPSYLSSYVVK